MTCSCRILTFEACCPLDRLLSSLFTPGAWHPALPAPHRHTSSHWHAWHYGRAWKENEIISFEEYCKRQLFISNPAFMMRRDAELKPMEKYGLFFDDPIISAHHILRGKIICSERADYVYVQYPKSIWNKISEGDRIVREITPTIVYLKFFLQYKKAILDMGVRDLIISLKAYFMQSAITYTPETVAYAERLQNSTLQRMIHGKKCYQLRPYILLYMLLLRNTTHWYITDSVIVKLLR